MFGVKQLRTVSHFFFGGRGGGCYVSSMADFGSNISRGGDLSIVCMYCTYIVSIFSSFSLLAKTNRMTTEKKNRKTNPSFNSELKARKASARGIIKR